MQNHPIYALVNRQQITEILESFYICTNLPVGLLDKEGARLEYCGDDCNYCNILRRYLPEKACESMYIREGELAANLGESYIFTCNGNLNHILFPLVFKDEVIGSILAGPFLLDTPDSTLIQDLVRKHNISTSSMFDMYDELFKIRIMTPKHITHAARLLYYLCSGITENKNILNIKQIKLRQQAKIGESIQMYKTSEAGVSSYPYEKEKELITKVKTGNISEAKGVLNDLLGYVLFSEGNRLDAIKNRAIELCSLLSRAAIEGGAATDSTFKINNNFLKSLQQVKDLEELCYKLQEVVEEFTESMFFRIPSNNSEIIKKAIKYIAMNFNKQITLDEIASYVHLSSAYFSNFFKKNTGSTFKEYLNMIRIEESKILLSNAEYSIIDIAVATGFDSHSYFTKMFKNYTGLTPKQYRQKGCFYA